MNEEYIDEELKIKLYKDAERAASILESVYSTLIDKLGENAGDITDILPYIIRDINHDILERIGGLPTNGEK